MDNNSGSLTIARQACEHASSHRQISANASSFTKAFVNSFENNCPPSNLKAKSRTASDLANKDRNKYTKIISAIQTTEAYQKFISKQLSAINKLDSRRVLHCTLETPNEKALDNLNTLIKMALSLKPIKEYEELASNVLEFLKYLEDNWETLQNG